MSKPRWVRLPACRREGDDPREDLLAEEEPDRRAWLKTLKEAFAIRIKTTDTWQEINRTKKQCSLEPQSIEN